MTEPSKKWNDLGPRFVSAVVMIAVGLLSVWIGGYLFHVLIAAVCGIMVWELVSMLDSNRSKSPLLLGGVAAICTLAVVEIPSALAMPLVLAPSMLGLGRMEKGGVTYAVFAALIILAGFGMVELRDDFGMLWMLWLVMVVVVTDIAGYFAGRLIGGPKFWPKVSPKKTWSGTIAGWGGAAIVGGIFAMLTQAHVGLIGLSVAVSMASQLGDIAESAIKRRAGVKDSSNLIPGHGGLFDRFDGMLGAALFILIAGQIVGFPPGS